MILFFTKVDRFREKFGASNYQISCETAIRIITNKFEDVFYERDLEKKRLLSIHVVNALDTQDVAKAFSFSEVRASISKDMDTKTK
jgi:hypothetical protein